MSLAGAARRGHSTAWSRWAFAASIIVLGMHAIATRGVVGVWGPVPRFVPAQAALPWVVGGVVLACGMGLARVPTTRLAARILLGWLGLWLVLARLAEAAMAPAVEGYWSGCGETLVLAAAAWTLAFPGRMPGANGPAIARILYGVALIPFGLAHFFYLKETVALVPAWLPWPQAWAVFVGMAYLAAALALLTGILARQAAVLAAWQIGLLTALVWLPIDVSGRADASAWSETAISLALTAAACVLAHALWPTGGERAPEAAGSTAC